MQRQHNVQGARCSLVGDACVDARRRHGRRQALGALLLVASRELQQGDCSGATGGKVVRCTGR